MYDVMRDRLGDLDTKLGELQRGLSLDTKVQELRSLESKMAQPDFWDRQEEAQRVVKSVSRLKAETQPFVDARRRLEDQRLMLDLVEEESDAQAAREVERELEDLVGTIDRLELQAMLSGPLDARSCFLTVNAGAGGTESCDWAQMLLRMYSRWSEDQGYKVELVDDLAGEEAGLRHATIRVAGPFAYGKLKCELGVHRLVRISPYDAQARRHTSFASVDVVPEMDEEQEIDIKDSDLRIDTFCAGGAGGQHVNKTASAVRITHLPTGVVVKCQNERSQHQNRRVAMNMLHAKLTLLEESKRDQELRQSYDAKGQIAWGHQIRSYVLQPYTMVKDHRTDEQTGNAQAVLDGDIDRFIESYLRWKLRAGQAA